ncbi:MAG: MFS transporter, partial [Ginsengibacter sp.]
YLLRSAFNRGSVGARQALTVGMVRDKRRGFAISMNSLSMQVPQSVGPSVAGFLFSEGNLQLPFFAGAVFQTVYLVLYQRFFRKVDVVPAD